VGKAWKGVIKPECSQRYSENAGSTGADRERGRRGDKTTNG
jgi:hypothetical protein